MKKGLSIMVALTALVFSVGCVDDAAVDPGVNVGVTVEPVVEVVTEAPVETAVATAEPGVTEEAVVVPTAAMSETPVPAMVATSVRTEEPTRVLLVVAEPTGEPVEGPEMGAGDDALVRNLSVEERECLTADIRTDEDLAAAVMGMMGMSGGPAMDCLSEESQFEVYLWSAETEDDGLELMVETHRCIWDAMVEMGDVGEFAEAEAAEVEDAMQIFGRVMAVMMTVPAYCIAVHEDEDHFAEMMGVGDDGADGLAELEGLVCVIDAAGGPAEWGRLLLVGDAEAAMAGLENLADEECGFVLDDDGSR